MNILSSLLVINAIREYIKYQRQGHLMTPPISDMEVVNNTLYIQMTYFCQGKIILVFLRPLAFELVAEDDKAEMWDFGFGLVKGLKAEEVRFYTVTY
jgi:hypothetical protein